jgi:hypothetical protein
MIMYQYKYELISIIDFIIEKKEYNKKTLKIIKDFEYIFYDKSNINKIIDLINQELIEDTLNTNENIEKILIKFRNNIEQEIHK